VVGTGGDSGGWLKQNYDKLLLVLVLIGLLGSAVFLILKVSSESDDLKGNDWPPPSRKISAQDVDFSEYEAKNGPLEEPFVGRNATTNLLMVSEVRVICVNPNHQGPIPFSAMVCLVCGAKQPPLETIGFDRDEDSMTDDWEDKNGLNKYDPKDAVFDPDGDGFTNLDEFQGGGTDPNDPREKPPITSKLRWTRIDTQPLQVLFEGVFNAPEGTKFQLNERKTDKTWFKFLGEEAEGYMLSEYIEEAEQGPKLILTNEFEVIELPKGRTVYTQRRSADLIFLLDGKRFREMKLGQSIELEDLTYNIVDITKNEVVIRDDSEEEIRVKKISRREAQILKRGGTNRRPRARGAEGRDRTAPIPDPFSQRR
jgi:hypothetical protein